MPFMSNSVPLLVYCAVYLLFIYYYGIDLMKTRLPYKLTTFVRCYNIFQVIACTYFVIESRKFGLRMSNAWTCIRPYLGEYGDHELDCYWYFLLLRGFEFIETVVFVLRKKSNHVSFLHVYHHVRTLWITWLLFRSVPGIS